MENQSFRNFIPLLKVLIWPFMVGSFYSLNYPAINDSISALPNIVKSSSKITVGNLVFEINEKAKSRKLTDVSELIESLSPNEIKYILRGEKGLVSLRTTLGNNREYLSFNLTDLKVINSLSTKGLIKIRKFKGVRIDLSTYSLPNLMKELDTEYNISAIDELERRGYSNLSKDLILKQSKERLDLIGKEFGIKNIINSDEIDLMISKLRNSPKNKRFSYDDSSNSIDKIIGPLTINEKELMYNEGLLSTQILLSEVGKKTYNLIIEVVADQFKKNTN